MLVFMRRWALVFASLWLVSLASPAYADPALDWVSTVETATTKLPGARGDRARAIAWLAAFNALNTIEPRYRPYAPAPAATESDATAPAPMATLASALYTALAVEPEADQALLLRSYRARIPQSSGVLEDVIRSPRSILRANGHTKCGWCSPLKASYNEKGSHQL